MYTRYSADSTSSTRRLKQINTQIALCSTVSASRSIANGQLVSRFAATDCKPRGFCTVCDRLEISLCATISTEFLMATEEEFNAETPAHYHFYSARIPELAYGFVITPRFKPFMDDAGSAYAVLHRPDWYDEAEGFYQYRDAASASHALTAFDHLIALGMIENPALADAFGGHSGRVTRQQIQEAAANADAEPEEKEEDEEDEEEDEDEDDTRQVPVPTQSSI